MISRIPALMFEKDVVEFLVAHPEYARTLRKAIFHEEQNQTNQHYLGWEWHDVGTAGAKLVRLVTNDIARINFKSNRTTCYLLGNREVVKKALTTFDANAFSRGLAEVFDRYGIRK